MSSRSTLEFLKTETGSGLLLAAAAAIAVAWANSPVAAAYFAVVDHPLTIQAGAFSQTMSLFDWVRNGLMAIFFFIVGLQIKYEVLRGELSNPRRLALPVLAAIGGVAAPAAIYLAINASLGGPARGWPTPVATDIALAVAVLAIAAPKLPTSLRLFLLTLAIADDLIAVVLIAVLFTKGVSFEMLAGAALTLAVLASMSRWKTAPLFFYIVAFALLWAFTLQSGINTSVAGVVAAFTIPIDPRRPGQASLLSTFMSGLHPYVAFLILPLFAFCAAGFSVSALPLRELLGPVSLGVALGLFLGKQLGVFGAAALAISLKLARRPTGARWSELYGVCLLCGIGFTMSLFIGGLAFEPSDVAGQTQVRMGVIAGSLLSGLCGMAVLAWAGRRRAAEAD